MPELGRISVLVQDTTGAVVSGATCAVRRQGATVDGSHSSQTTITVHHSGAIEANDVIAFDTNTSPTHTVASTTATTVVLTTSASPADNARIRIVSSTETPTQLLYLDVLGVDPLGGGSPTNDMTTGADGLAVNWITGGKYDVFVSDASITDKLLQDVTVYSEQFISQELNTGTTVIWDRDTFRSITQNGATLFRYRHGGSDVFRVILQDAIWRGVMTGNFIASTALAVGSATLGATGTLATSSNCDFGGDVRIAGDRGSGTAGQIGHTNSTDLGLSTGDGTVKMTGATNRDSNGWLKFYLGTTEAWIPFWTTIN